MIERQGGIPKVAMLPEGAKDLDAWILSLDEEEREQKIGELLAGALPVEQFEQKYLNSDSAQEKRQPEFEELGGGEQEGVSFPGPGLEQGEPENAGEGSAGSDSDPQAQQTATEPGEGEAREGHRPAPTDSRRQTDSSRMSSQDYETGADEQDASGGAWEQLQLSADEDSRQQPQADDTAEHGATQLEAETAEDDTTERELPHTHQQLTDARRHTDDQLVEGEEDGEPPGRAYSASVKGEGYLLGLLYAISALMLSVAAWVVLGGALAWAGSLVLGAGLAIPAAIGFSKIIGWHNGRRLRRHIEGN